jgi:hypothetical protein
MSNVNNITAGHLDRVCGTFFVDVPHLDKFTKVAKACRDADEQERGDLQRAIYADMYAYAEKLADQIKRLKELDAPGLSKPCAVSGILNNAILALEAEGVV